ncbi:MAG: mechanosensitive ion channel family protein [Candidatus Limiplasma sp.]|nr:mechanosensitive ion channel family protein [Candidatus Limiplasma sp.]MEA5146044.1 mechanosensitive ion channel family protein [Candidatus Limiplasma sp.]
MARPTPVPEIIETVSDTLETASQAAGQFLTNLPIWLSKLMLAAVVVLVGALLVRLGRKLINRLVQGKKGSQAKSPGQRETLRSLVISVFNYTMYFILVTVVLGIFGVNVTSMIAVAGVGGIAIGFGAQTLVKDVISGIFLWMEGNITVGDIVEVNNLSGEVEAIAIRTTTIRNYSGNLYVIPNGDIRTVTNMTRSYKRAIVDVRLPYDEKLDRLLDVLTDEMEKASQVLTELSEVPQVLGILSYDPDAIIVRISATCTVKENWGIERELRRRIKERFDLEGIQMPHVQRITL